MSKSAIPVYERRLLTPQRTLQIKPSGIPKSRKIVILQAGKKKYHVDIDSKRFSGKVDITVRSSEPNKEPTFATARLNGREPGFALFIGDPSTATPIAIEEDVQAGMLDRNFTFMLIGQAYAWQRTGRHSIRIPTSDGQGIAEDTDGHDLKLIKMSGMKPKIDDEVVAAYIRERNNSSLRGDSGAANIHWFEAVGEDFENAVVAVLMGIVERERKSSKEYTFGAAGLFG